MCVYTIMDITANIAYLIFVTFGNVEHRLNRGSWLQRAIQTGLCNAAGIVYINIASGHSIDHDICLAFCPCCHCF